VLSPYIYAEDNWTDDMELAYAALFSSAGKPDTSALNFAYKYALEEPVYAMAWRGYSQTLSVVSIH
jgi:hypothetical protein